MKFTFKDGIEIEYEKVSPNHRMKVDHKGEMRIGPWILQRELLSYECNGRYFICQRLIDKLPRCFELIKPAEIQMETIEPPISPILSTD